MSVKQISKNLGRAINRNSPTILTGLSVAGMLSTVIMAVNATPKAIELLSQEVNQSSNPWEADAVLRVARDEMSKMEIIKATYKCYIPTAIMGGMTIACIVGANKVNMRRNAALASLYSISDAALKEYQSKVIETIGEKKHRAIKDEVAKDYVTNNPPENNTIVMTGKGEVLCLDKVSGRYFKNDHENLRRIQNDINERLLVEDYISLTDFYYELGLEPTKLSDNMGWRTFEGGMLDITFTTAMSPDGQPCLVLDYDLSGIV